MSTNCEFPPELDDKQLLAYLDDHEANQEAARHLGICSHCREKAEALAHFQKRLTTRLYRITCPPPIELGEYHLRMLPSSRMLVVSQHLRECPHCIRELEQLKEFLSEPAPGLEWNLFQQPKVLIARLVSWRNGSGVPGTPAFVLRGESEGPLTFEVDGFVIVLDIQTANEGMVSILGQVAADDQEQWTGATVTLQQIDESHTTYLDDLGAFRFEETPSGPGQITITSLQGIEVKIPNIDIKV